MEKKTTGWREGFFRPIAVLVACALACACAVSAPVAAQAKSDAGLLAGSLGTAAAVWNGEADTGWYDPGAEAYTVGTAEELAGLAAIVNGTASGIEQCDFAGKTVRLSADITLNAYAATGPDASQRNWTPIGARPVAGVHAGSGGMQPAFGDPQYFRGTFDGQGHVIENIYINNVAYPDSDYPGVTDYGGYQGLFGALGDGAVVKNVGIYGGYVAGRVAGGIAALGAPASVKTAPSILNCYNTACIAGDGSSSRGSGGIFGGEYGSEGDNGRCFIANCYNVGSVQGKSGNAGASLGGIAGCGIVEARSCYNVGEIAQSGSAYRGGIVGLLAQGGTVRDCYSLASAHPALYDSAAGATDGGCLLDQAHMLSLVIDGKLSAAFVGDGTAEPALFWEAGSAQPTDVTASAVVAAVPKQVYTGSAITPALSVTYQGRTLKEGSDYRVVYANNVNATTASSPATYTITFMGAYAGTIAGTFEIGSSTLDTATISNLGPQWVYGTQPVVPELVVKDATGRLLVQDTDYRAVFENNDRAGIAHVTIEPADGSSYVGSKTVSFPIVAASDHLEGSGTEDDPYTIASRADMQYFAHAVNTLPDGEDGDSDTLAGVFRLSADIDMAATDNEPAVDLVGTSVWSDESGYRTKAFAGTLDGGSHTITMNADVKGGYFGLFPTNSEGTTVTVRNLTVAGTVKTTATAAVLFPSVYGSVYLQNVRSSVNVSAGYKAYGFVGTAWPRQNSILIEDCENTGAITGGAEAAGFVGEVSANSVAGCTFKVMNCTNSGTITAGDGGEGAKGTRAAGILGKLTQYQSSIEAISITNTSNTGSVAADGTAGGLVASVGSSDSSGLGSQNDCRHTITASFNTGSVTAGNIAGGLVGALFDNNKATLANVYNTGAVSAKGETGVAGGLIGGTQTGRAWYADVMGAYNAGVVSGSSDNAGAIMGFAGCGSYYAVAGGELTCENVYYLEDSAPDAIGTLQPEQVLAYFAYPAAKLLGAHPLASSATDMKASGPQGMAARIGSQFADDAAACNQGYPVLYWQAGVAGSTDISAAVVEAVADCEYTGGAITPVVTVVLDGVRLNQGSDFLVNVVGDAVSVRDGVEIEVVGIGRYGGSVEGLTFNIVKADISRFAIDSIASQWASANDPAEPQLTLRNASGAAINTSTGFAISYENNTGADARATATVTANQDNACYSGSVSVEFEVKALPDNLEGSGTLDDPYRIATYQQLELFAKRVNAQNGGYAEANARLVADIDIPGDVVLDSIGDGTSEYTNGAPFRGTFDGDGHTITLNYAAPTTYALFNGLEGATVKNLTMAGATTVTMQDAIRPVYGGTFAGLLDASVTFENCVNAVTVTGMSKCVGGFAAATDDNGIPAQNHHAGTAQIKFVNCTNKGAITGSLDAERAIDCVGGFLGYAYTKGFGGAIELTFENCTNYGDIRSEAGSSVGGVLGGASYDYDTDSEDGFKIVMSSVANKGAISAFDGAGGLVGVVTDVDELTIENAFNTGSVTISCPNPAHGELAGGLIAAALSNSYRANPILSVKNAYNAGAVSCSAAGADVDPLIGGVIGGLSYDEKYVRIANVYYSLDATDAGIGLDQSGAGWEAVIVPEYDDTMKAPSFAAELGVGFVTDGAEGAGYPELAASRIDLSGYSVTFYDAKNKLGNEQLDVPFTGHPATPSLVVRKVNSLVLPALAFGKDYIVFYKSNVNAGVATAIVQGIGDYRGTVAVPFTITGTGLIDDCTVAAIPAQVWTGEPVEPKLEVTKSLNGSTYRLEEGVDYTVTYANNVGAGTAGALVEGAGAWSGSKTVFFNIWKPTITVKVRHGNGPLEVAKHYTKAEFEALATSGEPVSALYFSDGADARWRVATAKSYVTFEDLFADAGVPWKQGVTVSYAAADDVSKESAFAYTDLNNRFFYPVAEAKSIELGVAAREVKPVLAIEEHSSAIGDNGTLFGHEAEAFNVEKATDGNEPRVITGITEQEALDKTARGARLIKNLDVIVVTVVDFGELNDAIHAAEQAAQGIVVSSDGGRDVPSSATWTTPAGKKAFDEALGRARAVAENPDATQQQINDALSVLAGAQDTLEALTARGAGGAKGATDAPAKKAKGVLKVKAKKLVVKSVKAKKKAIAKKKAFKVRKACGTVRFAKVKGPSKVKVTKKGKVVLKKGLKPGKYVVRVKVTATGDALHGPATKTVKLKIRVKK